MTPAELYQAEKAKRRAVGVKPLLPTKLVHLGEGNRGLRCPQCSSETVIIGNRRPSKVGGGVEGNVLGCKQVRADCADCGHTWRTMSMEAFNTLRVAEVRG